MVEYRCGNAIIRIHGETEREKLEEATMKFLKKVQKAKEKNNNGNNNSSRTINKK